MDIREFKNIYTQYAPSLIWDWCAKPTAEEIDAALMNFSDAGISNVFIRPSKGLVLPYLSEDYFELIRTAARRGAKYQISIWICDENSAISGNGGGEITSVSDYRMQDIVKVESRDVEKFDCVLSENGKFSTVLRDMSRMRASGRAPVPDITDAFVTECFTEAVYDKYIRQCSRFIGHEIKGFMTQINLPENALLYSPAAEKKLGNTSTSLIAEKLLSGDCNFTDDYYRILSQCIAESFTGIVEGKCRSNSLELISSVSGCKEISRQLQYMRANRISLTVDALNPDFVQIKLAESVSEQFQKPFFARLLLPSFAPCSLRYNAAAFLSSLGISSIIYDSVAFSLSDRRKHEKHTVTLSKFTERNISDRLSRLCFAGSGTRSAAKLLIIYAPRHAAAYADIAKSLLYAGIPFHMCEETFFEKHACVYSDDVSIGRCEYHSIILPDDAKIDIEGFCGRKISLSEFNIDDAPDSGMLKIDSDNPVIINRRINGTDEYVFVSGTKDTVITACPDGKNLLVADSSNGEIYSLSPLDGQCSFTLKAGKTVMLIYSDSLSGDMAPPFTDDIEIAPHTILGDVPFTLTEAGENILPLKNVNACFGRKSYRENIIDNLHREFYALPDGEIVKVKYPFTADVKNIGNVKVYIENANNLEFAQLNGKELTGFIPSEKDPRFMGLDITKHLSDGKNTLALEYIKANNYTPDFSSVTPSHSYSYNVTSFESVYLCGDFDCTDGTLMRLDEYENDVVSSGMPYYYGALTYMAKLPDAELSGTMLTVSGDFDICCIKVGKRSFTYFSETPLLELFNLDSGTVAEITVYNTPYNLLRTSSEDVSPFGVKQIQLSKFEY